MLSDKKVRSSDTQDVAFIDVMKTVNEATLKENKRLESLIQ